MKTHLAIMAKDGIASACGRGARKDTNIYRTDCLNCKATPVFITEKAKADAEREAAFHAQTPRTIVPQFGRVNADGVMECPWCAGVLWRERPRSLFYYHYVCANDECGKSVEPMTETGMCT